MASWFIRESVLDTSGVIFWYNHKESVFERKLIHELVKCLMCFVAVSPANTVHYSDLKYSMRLIDGLVFVSTVAVPMWKFNVTKKVVCAVSGVSDLCTLLRLADNMLHTKYLYLIFDLHNMI